MLHQNNIESPNSAGSCELGDIPGSASRRRLLRGKTVVIGVMTSSATSTLDYRGLAAAVTRLCLSGCRVVLAYGPALEAASTQLRQAASQEAGANLKMDSLELNSENYRVLVNEMRQSFVAAFSAGVTAPDGFHDSARVLSGTFLSPQPIGRRRSGDSLTMGKVRKVDTFGLNAVLGLGNVVLVGPTHYSKTGEELQLSVMDIAASICVSLEAEALLLCSDTSDYALSVHNSISTRPADIRLLWTDISSSLEAAVSGVIDHGIGRVHLLSNRHVGTVDTVLDGTRPAGIEVYREHELRAATDDDIDGIERLIRPLEESGALVRRDRATLERDIGNFHVVERDGVVEGCIALFPYLADGTAEIACLTVAPTRNGAGIGRVLLESMERLARNLGLSRVFILTSQTESWFAENGRRRFTPSGTERQI